MLLDEGRASGLESRLTPAIRERLDAALASTKSEREAPTAESAPIVGLRGKPGRSSVWCMQEELAHLSFLRASIRRRICSRRY